MKKKKIFISLPMSGVEEISKVRYEFVKAKLSKEYDVTGGWDVSGYEDGKTTAYYLSRDIEELMGCDYVIFLNDWQESKGCQVEHKICEVYNIPFIESENDDTIIENQKIWE